MKKSTTEIIRGPSLGLNISSSSHTLKTNNSLSTFGDVSKAFDLLYLHVSPVPKPFIGYHSLKNVVSKNLQVSNIDLTTESSTKPFNNINQLLHTTTRSTPYLLPNTETVNSSFESSGTQSSSSRGSTSDIIQIIKEKHAQLKTSHNSETLFNTQSTIKDKRKETFLEEESVVKDSHQNLKKTTSNKEALTCSTDDTLSKDQHLKSVMKNQEDQRSVQIVLEKCDSQLSKGVNCLSDKIIRTHTKQRQSSLPKTKKEDDFKLSSKVNDDNVLTDWIIKPVPGCRGVCVEGQKVGMQDYWHSTAIAEVRKPKVVVTTTGSVYKLKGKINKLCTIDNGFTQEIAEAFAAGFPKNWRELIQEYFISIEKSISFHEEVPIKMKKFGRKSSPLADKKTNSEDIIGKTIMTKHGLIQQHINVSDMVVTRSGRVSLPPLAKWVGQYYVKDPKSNAIKVGFNTKTAEKFIMSQTQNILKMPKSQQKKIFHKSLSNSLNSPTSLSPQSLENINRTFPDAIAQVRTNKELKPQEKRLSSDQHKQNSQSEELLLKDVSQVQHVKPAKKTNRKETSANEEKMNSEKDDKEVPKKGKRGRKKKVSMPDNSLSKENVGMEKSGRIPKVATTKTVSPDLSDKHQAVKSKKRKCPNSTVQQDVASKKVRVDDEKNDNAWSESETKLFHQALQKISSDESYYWNKVSEFVGTRSDLECQEFHANYLETLPRSKGNHTKKKKEQQLKVKKRQKGEPIRGGKGTLKRKKDLRAFLDEQNEGYEDDLFESTPMVKKITKSCLNFDFSKNDSELFGPNHKFFTPVAGRSGLDTPGTRIRASIASVRKEPMDSVDLMEDTPISSKRHKADVVIKKINDRKKKVVPVPASDKMETTSTIDLEWSALPVKSLFTPEAKPSISIDKDDDDEGKHLYYWDDDD
uniref:Myb-like domain-containing protein n=1 Tax=Biomphalaria glabrata TaxID=6526 RepID=A0A2C9LX06_BIOGL